MKLDQTTQGCQHPDVDLYSQPKDGFMGKCYDCGKRIEINLDNSKEAN